MGYRKSNAGKRRRSPKNKTSRRKRGGMFSFSGMKDQAMKMASKATGKSEDDLKKMASATSAKFSAGLDKATGMTQQQRQSMVKKASDDASVLAKKAYDTGVESAKKVQAAADQAGRNAVSKMETAVKAPTPSVGGRRRRKSHRRRKSPRRKTQRRRKSSRRRRH